MLLSEYQSSGRPGAVSKGCWMAELNQVRDNFACQRDMMQVNLDAGEPSSCAWV